MSVFETTSMACPSCASIVEVELVHSVNAVRRPDLRTAILDRTFQSVTCPSCATTFRVEPMFTYLDVGRKQFVAALPAGELPGWKAAEARAQAAYDKAFGKGSDGEALGRGMQARCVFGWLGLNEKLIAVEHGIDDVALEMAKMATMQSLGDVKLGADREFRLVGATDDELAVGWLRTSTEEIDEEYSVPRQLLADIEGDPKTWAKLRAGVSGGMFVDYRRPLFDAP
ncbi:MAG: CpXC domain-containing protein [Caldimonas sp.]